MTIPGGSGTDARAQDTSTSPPRVGAARDLPAGQFTSFEELTRVKRIVEISPQESGFLAVIGEKVTLYCGIYIYTGKLVGVNDDHLELADALLVYETGELASGAWKDAQRLPAPHRVMRQAIESWGPAKC